MKDILMAISDRHHAVMKPEIIYSEGDWPHVIQRGEIALGDTVLRRYGIGVDTSYYGVPGDHWCTVVYLSDGDTSFYPIKVELPMYGRGQYSHDQIKGIRS